jgi:hypothetical protein
MSGMQSSKRPRTDTDGPFADGSLSAGGPHTLGRAGSASSSSYAAAARSKRQQQAAPTFPRPHLVRGKPVHEEPDYVALERPAPAVVSPNSLYVDLRQVDLTVEEVLEQVYTLAKQDVLGFEMFAATKTLALIFPSAELQQKYVDQQLPDSNLVLYVAPPTQVYIRKFTLLGVPMHDPAQVLAQLHEIMKPFGKVVQLVPMLTRLGYWSTTWHLSLQVMKDDDVYPPPTIELLGKQVVCDIPGKRRFCKHCNGVEHVLASCRQGQRMRRTARQLQQAQTALDASLQQPQQPDHHNDALILNDTQMDYNPTHTTWALNQANRGGTDNNNGNGNNNGNAFDDTNSNGNSLGNGTGNNGFVANALRISSNVSGGHGHNVNQ